jgi:type IV secretion system protein VirB3
VARDLAVLVWVLHSFWGIPIGLMIHLFAVALSRKDPQFFEVLRRQVKQKKFYSD